MTPAEPLFTRKDLDTGQAARWCPGCGNYSVLAQVQKVLPTLGIPRERFVFVSGIGCSSRFPYYLGTYGLHGIHGRAPSIASGLKIARPELEVWVATGDGDALSIGGNHLIHALRRNVGLKIILFNNRIYGLTKGQTSPTSPFGVKTKSTPFGSIDTPFSALSLAIGAEGSFVARSMDSEPKHLAEMLARMARQPGASFLEVLQRCVVFNEKGFGELGDKEERAEHLLFLEHGKPMLFGKDRDRGIRWNPKTFAPEVVTLGENGLEERDLLVHDENAESPALAFMLSRMTPPDFPTPLGIMRAVSRAPYEQLVADEERKAIDRAGKGTLDALLRSGESWVIR